MNITPMPEIFFPVIIFYFAVMAYLGWLSSKKTDSIKDFLTMGGTAGAIVAGFYDHPRDSGCEVEEGDP